MNCPRCATAGSYRLVKAPNFVQWRKAPTAEPPYPEVYRLVRAPLGPNHYACAFCHYEPT